MWAGNKQNVNVNTTDRQTAEQCWAGLGNPTPSFPPLPWFAVGNGSGYPYLTFSYNSVITLPCLHASPSLSHLLSYTPPISTSRKKMEVCRHWYIRVDHGTQKPKEKTYTRQLLPTHERLFYFVFWALRKSHIHSQFSEVSGFFIQKSELPACLRSSILLDTVARANTRGFGLWRWIIDGCNLCAFYLCFWR